MQYMILIFGDEAAQQNMTPADAEASFNAYMEYNRSLVEAGVFRHAGRLNGSHSATVLRGVGGKIETTDGPFAETREQLGGYYVIEAEDLDSALEWGGRCPAVNFGGIIEVRPVMFSPEV